MSATDAIDHGTACLCAGCMQSTAIQHWNSDEACRIDWRTKGCGCVCCTGLRALLNEIDAGFAQVKAAEERLSKWETIRKKLNEYIDKKYGTP